MLRAWRGAESDPELGRACCQGGKRANFHGEQQLMAGAGGVGEWGHKDSADVSWHLVGLVLVPSLDSQGCTGGRFLSVRSLWQKWSPPDVSALGLCSKIDSYFYSPFSFPLSRVWERKG